MAADGVMTENPVRTEEMSKEETGSFLERMPHTETRVADQTAEGVNEQIIRIIEANVYYYARHPEGIDRRLSELEKEWDVERAVETAFSAAALGGFFLSLFGRRFSLLTGMAGGFMLQHALQGWCPALPIFRRMGVRSSREINLERYALKALRGDFEGFDMRADPASKANQAIEAALIKCRDS